MRAITLLLSALLAGPAIAQNREPIIDMHLHAFGFDEFGNPPPPNEVTGQVPRARTDDAAMSATLDAMRKHNVVMALASGPLPDVQRWVAANPERLIAGVGLGPLDTLPDAASLRRMVSEKSIAALGELGLQYHGLSASDPKVAHYFALAEELDIPVALHTGLGGSGTAYTCCPKFRTSLGNPETVEDMLIRHPKLRVYLMHAGYPYLAETKAILQSYPQVYVDISALNWTLPRAEFHSYLKALIDAGLGKRIMFGSDQMVWPDAIGLAIDGVDQAPFLSPEQKRDIFYNNAAVFLRLEQVTIDRHHRK
ncbi:MAG TPA: amidohydrolase family protein [Thermomonas sp.]|nr:amidohydrolase family protein [Thermomonas sp.]